jgi:hypothetical protein
LYDKAYESLISSQYIAYEIIHDVIVQFYEDYTPELYERTEQLLRSLVKGRVYPTAKGYAADIYFDLSSLNYVTGNQPSGEQVMAAASQGLHGAIGSDLLYVDARAKGGSGVGVWKDSLRVLNAEAIRILKDSLIAHGIPIK